MATGIMVLLDVIPFKKGAFVPAICWCFAGHPAAALEAVHVPAREYAAVAEREIDAAAEDVRVYLYLFSPFANQPGAWPTRLARALGRARARGVRVEVVLEPGDGGEVKNDNAVALLRQEGVPVFYAEGPLLHAKALVVDGKTVLAGSTNWTSAAFSRNAEADFLIRSTEAARSLLDELAALPRRAPPEPDAGPPVLVPTAFLTQEDKMGSMVTDEDERAFDAYLYFLWIGVSTGTATAVDRKSLCDVAQWPDTLQIRQQLARLLRRLSDKYGLIELVGDQRKGPSLRLRPLAGEGVVPLPEAYFRFGWPRRLTSHGKVFYLINLHRAGASPISPRWSFGAETLSRLYHVSPWLIHAGVMELRRKNLVEVEYAGIPPDRNEPRHANTYTPNALYDPAAAAATLRSLEEDYGAAAAARAEKMASLVYEDDDLGAVEALADAERRYGPAAVDQAAKVLGDKNPDNPKRNIAYFLGTIRRLAEKQ